MHLIPLAAALGVLMALVQLGALTIAFDKLGLAPESAFLLLAVALAGSLVNLPLFTVNAEVAVQHPPGSSRGWHPLRLPTVPGKVVIAVNVGGGVIPLTFSAYLLHHHPLEPAQVIIAVAAVATICHVSSRPMPGLGIGMPILVAPLTAAVVAVLIGDDLSAPLAYICGTLGVVIGADLLRLRDIRRMGSPHASIGGAGTFDGIFITGLVAVLLA